MFYVYKQKTEEYNEIIKIFGIPREILVWKDFETGSVHINALTPGAPTKRLVWEVCSSRGASGPDMVLDSLSQADPASTACWRSLAHQFGAPTQSGDQNYLLLSGVEALATAVAAFGDTAALYPTDADTAYPFEVYHMAGTPTNRNWWRVVYDETALSNPRLLLGGKKNFKSSTFGVIEVPELQATVLDELPDTPPEELALPDERVAVIADDPGLLMGRYARPGLDMSFKLFGEHEGEVREEHTLGRLWDWRYSATVTTMAGGSGIAVKKPVLAEAFAGFRSGIMDHNAIRSLAAVTQVLGAVGQTDVIPDNVRSMVMRMQSTTGSYDRLLLRCAILWVSTGAIEAMGGEARIYNAVDDNSPRFITSLGDWSLAIVAADSGREQPIPANLRLASGQSGLRVLRALALQKPTIADQAGDVPGIMNMWPSIPGARASIFQPAADLTPLPGPITNRDVGLIMQYLARVYSLTEELKKYVDFAAMHVLRPAGSGIYGQWTAMTQTLPVANHTPMALAPLLQGSDSMGDEAVDPAFLYPEKTIYKGTAKAVVWLASINNVAAAYGAPQAAMPTYMKTAVERLTSELKWFSRYGSHWALLALQLAQDIGACGKLPLLLASTAPRGVPQLGRHAVETEEALPFLRKVPDTAAVLGLFKCAQLDTEIPLRTFVRIGTVVGRTRTGDAVYSLLAMDAVGKVAYRTVSRTGVQIQQVVPTKSYRDAPSDGNFTSGVVAGLAYEPLVSIDSEHQLFRALRAHIKRGKWRWYYTWGVPHTEASIYAQAVGDYEPTERVEVLVSAPEPKTLVGPPASLNGPVPIREAKPNPDWSVTLGSAVSQTVEYYESMLRMVGRQLATPDYEERARALGNNLLALDLEMMTMVMEPADSITFMRWYARAAMDAAEWEPRPLYKRDLVARGQQASNLSATLLVEAAECEDVQLQDAEQGAPHPHTEPAADAHLSELINAAATGGFQESPGAGAPAPVQDTSADQATQESQETTSWADDAMPVATFTSPPAQ